MPNPEVQARQYIDRALEECGWVVQPYKDFDPTFARGVALTEIPLKAGTADYLLFVDRNPVGVIQTKKEGPPLSGMAEQSGHYGDHFPDFLAIKGSLPFAYESTGVETFFRDRRDPQPRSLRVFTFHRPETLADWFAQPDSLRKQLVAMPFAHPLAKKGMRGCQSEAIKNLDNSFAADYPRALIQNLQLATRLRQSILQKACPGELTS